MRRLTMPDYPERPALAFIGRIALFIFHVCLVLIAGVGTGWLVVQLIEALR